MSGLSSSGFDAKRLPEIQTELAEAFSLSFGEIDTSADSVFGQIIGVLSKPLADLWEQMEQVYFSQYPDTASGVPLDYAVALSGITRNPATFSQGTVALKGDDGTVVPALTQIAQKSTGILFQTVADATITLTNAIKVTVNIETVTEGHWYFVVANSEPCAYQAVFGDTKEDVVAGLLALVETNLYAFATASNKDHATGSFTLTALTGSVSFTIYSTTAGNVTTSEITWWTPVDIIALDKGAISAPEGTLIEIVNAVAGLDAVYNFTDIDLDSGMGRAIESDSALRLRRLETLKSTGAGTVEAIRSRLLNDVVGVVNAYVFENVTDGTVGGRPPHSIECVVAGGADQAIAEEIWLVKAGGIKTYGHVGPFTVIDSQGNNQSVYFSRPFERKAWVFCFITKTNEELFPTGGDVQIQGNIIDYGNSLILGNDIFYQRFFSPIYDVSGIASADLYISVPKYEFNVSGTYADMPALLTAMEAAGGFTFENDDEFYVDGTGDTTDTALATAKGSAPAANDLFRVVNRSTSTVTYRGNLVNPVNYQQTYKRTNIAIAGTEYVVFENSRTFIVIE